MPRTTWCYLIPATAVLAMLALPPFAPAHGVREASSASHSSPPTIVSLRTVVSSSGQTFGMSNLFFADPADETIPTGWDSVGVAELSQGIMVARGLRSGAWEYRIDTDRDQNFLNERDLEFAGDSAQRVANFAVVVPGARAPIHFQILRAEAGYVYGRIAQDWRGEFAGPSGRYIVRIQAPSRMKPLPRLGDPIELDIDLDGDGSWRTRSEVGEDGQARLAERVSAREPFWVGGETYRISAIDLSAGTLTITPSALKVAAAPGFLAPPLATRTLDGAMVSLAKQRGRITVVEFWSVHCPFSERVRPAIRTMSERYGEKVGWVSIAREISPDTVRAHLRDHAMAGTAWRNTTHVWDRFNPETITPMFYVVDAVGKIVAVERGAESARVLDAILGGLVGSAR